MKFYAYVPTKEGREPVGGDRKLIFELKTVAGAHKRARSVLGARYRLFTYTNFYRESTFRKV